MLIFNFSGEGGSFSWPPHPTVQAIVLRLLRGQCQFPSLTNKLATCQSSARQKDPALADRAVYVTQSLPRAPDPPLVLAPAPPYPGLALPPRSYYDKLQGSSFQV